MFKPISAGLRRKEQALSGDARSTADIFGILDAFFFETFNVQRGEFLLGAEYRPQEAMLTLSLRTKAHAQEVGLRANALVSSLQKRGVVIRRLVVR